VGQGDQAGRNSAGVIDILSGTDTMPAVVVAVSRSKDHTFSKYNAPMIRLVVGLGVEGDAHQGHKVQHLYRARKDPEAPNLRQVHLIHEELLQELGAAGFDVQPGAIGENVTTRGLDLLTLPTGTRLHLGKEAVIEVTGLRNPCRQMDAFAKGLTAAVLERSADGHLVRKAGIMAIVINGGAVQVGDAIMVELPMGEYRSLVPV
jgi:MOSC domain-containing protein YiiM